MNLLADYSKYFDIWNNIRWDKPTKTVFTEYDTVQVFPTVDDVFNAVQMCDNSVKSIQMGTHTGILDTHEYFVANPGTYTLYPYKYSYLHLKLYPDRQWHNRFGTFVGWGIWM